MQLPSGKVLKEIYGEEAAVRARFERLAGNFVRVYGDAQAEFFSAPGRTEIIGNHTDHNGGICRVHGGGFAGVIMCVVPSEHCAEYVCFIGNYVGEENVYPMNIRQTGAVHMETEVTVQPSG